jgi:hypothetical protein
MAPTNSFAISRGKAIDTCVHCSRGALAMIRYGKICGSQQHRSWLSKLLERRPTKVVAIALANNIALMA